jgi:hypothetical protein
MTRQGYIDKFASFLNRPEIADQRKADGADGAPLGPWYHWTRGGVDFITLDNASHDEFSDAQLHWLRGVLDRDLAHRTPASAPSSPACTRRCPTPPVLSTQWTTGI